jgi:hypothetical protein
MLEDEGFLGEVWRGGAGGFWPDANTKTKRARAQATTLDMGSIVSRVQWAGSGDSAIVKERVTGYHLGK